MFCKECGAPVKEGARFCEYCGSPVEVPMAAPEPEPTPETEPKDDLKSLWTEPEDEEDFPKEAPKPADPVRPLLRKLANSGAVWVLIIALTLSMLLSVAGAFTMRPGDFKMEASGDLSEFLRENPELQARTGIDPNVLEDTFTPEVRQSLQKAAFIGAKGFSIAAQIPALLILIGVWMVFCSVRSKSEKASSAGIRLIRGVTVYQFVILCVILGLILLPLFVFLLYSVFTANLGAALAVLFGIFFFALLALPFILYYAKLLRTLRAMRNAIENSEADYRASRYVSVICILFAVGGLFTLAFNFLAGICNIAVYISAAILLFRYREEMQRLSDSSEYRVFKEAE